MEGTPSAFDGPGRWPRIGQPHVEHGSIRFIGGPGTELDCPPSGCNGIAPVDGALRGPALPTGGLACPGIAMIGVWSGLLIALALAFAWSIGAHYTGACMGMAYAAGAIRLDRALFVIAPLALVGATYASQRVETTVGQSILATVPVPIPLAVAVVGSAFALTTAYNVLKLPTSTIQIFVFALVGAGLASGVGILWHTIGLLLAVWAAAPPAAFALAYLVQKLRDRRRSRIEVAGRSLAVPGTLLVAGGALISFTMGANDVANASGPLLMTGVVGILLAGLLGGIAIAAGVLSWGKPLLRQVAHEIVRLDPAMASTAQLVQGLVVLVAVAFGLFTSLNQALVGALAGVGLARGAATVHRRTIRSILIGWAIGPASGAALGFLVAAGLHPL